MALFSDVDWVILAVAAAFLLFGKESGQTMRTLGRWYGRMLRFKADLLSEVTTSAGVGPGPAGPSSSVRAALFGATVPGSSAPAPDPVSPSPVVLTQVQPVALWAVETRNYGAGLGVQTWWVSTTSVPGEVVHLR